MGHLPQPSDVLRKRVATLVQELPAVEQGDVEALHRTRVASRRLREVVPILGLSPDSTRELKRGLRSVTKELGAVRELDVAALLVDKVQRRRRFRRIAIDKVRAAVAAARGVARERLMTGLASGNLKALADELERTALLIELREAGKRRRDAIRNSYLRALDERLASRAAEVRRAIEVVGTRYAPDHLHAVRIALKKLRYTAELLPKTGRRLTRYIAVLKAAQDLLGDIHDLEALVDWGRKAQESLSPSDVATRRQLAAIVSRLELDCQRLHARYVGQLGALIALTHRMGTNRAATPVRDRLGYFSSQPKAQQRSDSADLRQ